MDTPNTISFVYPGDDGIDTVRRVTPNSTSFHWGSLVGEDRKQWLMRGFDDEACRVTDFAADKIRFLAGSPA